MQLGKLRAAYVGCVVNKFASLKSALPVATTYQSTNQCVLCAISVSQHSARLVHNVGSVRDAAESTISAQSRRSGRGLPKGRPVGADYNRRPEKAPTSLPKHYTNRTVPSGARSNRRGGNSIAATLTVLEETLTALEGCSICFNVQGRRLRSIFFS